MIFDEDKERRIKKLGYFFIYKSRRTTMFYVLMNEITHKFVPVMLAYPRAHIMCQYDRSDPIRYNIFDPCRVCAFWKPKVSDAETEG